MHLTSDVKSACVPANLFNAHVLLKQVALPLAKAAIETTAGQPGTLTHPLDGLVLVLEYALTELENAAPEFRDPGS